MGRMFAAGLLAMTAMVLHAGELGLLVNGHAIHLEQREGNGNEDNYGLGLQYDQPWRAGWLWFVFSSGFQSSQNEPAYNAGGGLRRRYRFDGIARDLHADVGAAAMVLAHNGYREAGPIAALLPVASLGWSHFALNAAFVPPVDDRVVPLVFLQFMYSLDLGERREYRSFLPEREPGAERLGEQQDDGNDVPVTDAKTPQLQHALGVQGNNEL